MFTLNKKMMSFLYFLVLYFCVIIVKGQAGTIKLQMSSGLSDDLGAYYTVTGYKIDNTEVYSSFENHLRNNNVIPERVTYTGSYPIGKTSYLHVRVVQLAFPLIPPMYCYILLHDNNTASLDTSSTEECQLYYKDNVYTLYLAPPTLKFPH